MVNVQADVAFDDNVARGRLVLVEGLKTVGVGIAAVRISPVEDVVNVILPEGDLGAKEAHAVSVGLVDHDRARDVVVFDQDAFACSENAGSIGALNDVVGDDGIEAAGRVGLATDAVSLGVEDHIVGYAQAGTGKIDAPTAPCRIAAALVTDGKSVEDDMARLNDEA